MHVYSVDSVRSMYMYTYIHTYIHTYTHIYTHTTALRSSAALVIEVSLQHVFICMYVCVYIYIYIHMHLYLCAHKHIYTHTSALRFSAALVIEVSLQHEAVRKSLVGKTWAYTPPGEGMQAQKVCIHVCTSL
jgi:hypothetical protein